MIRIILAFFGYVKIPKEVKEAYGTIYDWHVALQKAEPDNARIQSICRVSELLKEFFREER